MYGKQQTTLLLPGVGSVFCQGVDLLHLCCDNPETRRERAVELADAAERLVLALSSFPKVRDILTIYTPAICICKGNTKKKSRIFRDKVKFKTFYFSSQHIHTVGV